VAKKRKSKGGSGWSWRLAGIALCVFFALGVVTGLSQSGRLLAYRIEAWFDYLPHTGRSQLIPAAYRTIRTGAFLPDGFRRSPLTTRPAHEVIALVEQAGSFYQLNSQGQLLGPVPPAETPNLPILSGPGVDSAQAARLLDEAAELVRAEALLSEVVSEMHVDGSGTAKLFLDRSHLVIVLGPDQASVQLARAARVLNLWRAHRELIGIIDMTAPGEAVVGVKQEMIEK